MLDTEPVITDLELVIVDVEMTDSAVVVELFLARRHSIRLVKKIKVWQCAGLVKSSPDTLPCNLHLRNKKRRDFFGIISAEKAGCNCSQLVSWSGFCSLFHFEQHQILTKRAVQI